MNKDSQEGLSGIICLIFFCVGIWLIGWVPFRSEYVTYEVLCRTYSPNGTCDLKGELAGPKVTYRPDRETKTVVFWVDGQPPEKFDNCAIADVKNWSCVSRGSTHQMVDGVFDSPLEGQYPRQVSKAKWWWEKFKKI